MLEEKGLIFHAKEQILNLLLTVTSSQWCFWLHCRQKYQWKNGKSDECTPQECEGEWNISSTKMPLIIVIVTTLSSLIDTIVDFQAVGSRSSDRGTGGIRACLRPSQAVTQSAVSSVPPTNSACGSAVLCSSVEMACGSRYEGKHWATGVIACIMWHYITQLTQTCTNTER